MYLYILTHKTGGTSNDVPLYLLKDKKRFMTIKKTKKTSKQMYKMPNGKMMPDKDMKHYK